MRRVYGTDSEASGTGQGASERARGGWTARAGLMRALGIAGVVALPLATLGGSPSAGHAAAVNPLPAVAKALTGVTSYQAVVTTTVSGTPRPRPSGTPRPVGTPRPGGRGQFRGLGLGFGFGPSTRTIVAVRKNGTFEDHVVISGKDRAGKAVTTDLIIYGTKICAHNGSSAAYTCQTVQNPYNLDPTAAFAGGAGSTTFTAVAGKTVNGQACDGYRYSNTSQFSVASGVVYIGHSSHLPCEQDATITRRPPSGSNQGGGGTFTQKTTTIWSRYNDKRLTVPALPS